MARYKIIIDEMLCQGHGVCTEECPEVFEVIDHGTGYPKVQLKITDPGEALLSKVRDAVEYCPNRTLRLIAVE